MNPEREDACRGRRRARQAREGVLPHHALFHRARRRRRALQAGEGRLPNTPIVKLAFYIFLVVLCLHVFTNNQVKVTRPDGATMALL